MRLFRRVGPRRRFTLLPLRSPGIICCLAGDRRHLGVLHQRVSERRADGVTAKLDGGLPARVGRQPGRLAATGGKSPKPTWPMSARSQGPGLGGGGERSRRTAPGHCAGLIEQPRPARTWTSWAGDWPRFRTRPSPPPVLLDSFQELGAQHAASRGDPEEFRRTGRGPRARRDPPPATGRDRRRDHRRRRARSGRRDQPGERPSPEVPAALDGWQTDLDQTMARKKDLARAPRRSSAGRATSAGKVVVDAPAVYGWGRGRSACSDGQAF